jgi:hypothetical protein
VRNLIEEAGKNQDRPTPRLIGRPSAVAQCFATFESRITTTGQQNHPPNYAICVHIAARDRAQRISAPDVTWGCALCLVLRNITPQ